MPLRFAPGVAVVGGVKERRWGVEWRGEAAWGRLRWRGGRGARPRDLLIRDMREAGVL